MPCVLQAAEEQAARVADFQAQSEAAQARLADASEALVASSHGIQLGLAALQSTQRHSQTLLTGLLGASYTWGDAYFYFGSSAFALALGWFPATHAARVPLLGTLALALSLERGVLLRTAAWSAVRPVQTHFAKLTESVTKV